MLKDLNLLEEFYNDGIKYIYVTNTEIPSQHTHTYAPTPLNHACPR